MVKRVEEKRESWDLDRLTSGEYAALRRAAGTVEPNVAAWRAFYRVDDQPDSGIDARYTALCMSCLWRREDAFEILPMEECLRRLCWDDSEGTPTLRESLARRVDALLETRWSQDGYFQGKLLNLVKIIRSDGRFKPDFEALAKDIQYWNGEKRFVQRRWLKVIYQKRMDENKGEEENQDDA